MAGIKCIWGHNDDLPFITIMLLTSFGLAILAGRPDRFGSVVRIAIIFGFLGYYVFHYSHLAMAEILCSLATLGGIRFIYDRLQGGGRWTLPSACFLMFIAYSLKIQFIYTAIIPPVAFGLALLFGWNIDTVWKVRTTKDIIISILFACAFAAIYGLFWIAPQADFFIQTVIEQVKDRSGYSGAQSLASRLCSNIIEIIRDYRSWPLLIPVPFALVLCWKGWIASTKSSLNRINWIAVMAPTVAWIMVESHKLTLSYLPSRYLVPFYVALAMVCAAGIVSASLTPNNNLPRVLKTGTFALMALVITLNLVFYIRAIQQRTYSIHDAQVLFSANDRWRGKVVMGPWAPTLFWGSGAITLPVWKDKFNDKDILAHYHPSILISEVDQQDTNNAFANDGIDLHNLAENIIPLHVGNWDILVFQLRDY